ncbi:hypothetical protein [uncultured Desulfobacter sp.]|uniref:hypothetical protein n=1 Tax=uncultured Desulfobacter sp. TaxID=240139 RepID=UPI002AAA8345|nr:hypothetical protein [uncultured Desulfobacter sp.]
MVAENKIIPGANKVIRATDRMAGFGGGYKSNVPGRRKKDRRKAHQDRRKSVRDGVIVALSFKKDRRRHPDRRFRSSYSLGSSDDAKGPDYDLIA